MWERNRTHQIAPQDLTVDDVPCVYVEDHGNGKGHVGIVVGFDPSTGRYQEVAANTTDKGSREGGNLQGVHALDRRTIHDDQLVGFLRIG